MAARQRVFRVRKNIFTEFNDEELIQRYRFDRNGILFVTELIREEITPRTACNMSISAELKVALTLRYLATGKMQLCNGDDMGLSQPTVSRAITHVLTALSNPQITRRFIKFPTEVRQIQQKKADFAHIAGFPGVVGTIDGTQIRIQAPRDDEQEYVNRKNYHSLNVQVVFDNKYLFLDIVAKWPGSTHDSRIFRESGLRRLFEDTNLMPQGTHLLGDSGYACRRWLLTPYLNPQPGAQTNYNRAHKRTRSVVERGIGQWKRRFHVLNGEIRLSPDKASKVVLCCAVLHNICKLLMIPLPQDGNDDDNQPDSDDDDNDINRPQAARDGNLYRQHFTNLHFQYSHCMDVAVDDVDGVNTLT